MPKIFLTHTADMRKNYYGERALAELRKLGEVRVNDTGRVLDAPALAEAARGCEIIVSDRQTPGPAEFFPLAPDLVAFLRVAVDIRNIDVAAASAQGILVTRATPGFTASVAEMAIGFMVDLARHVTHSVADYRAGREPEPRMGRQLKGATLGIIGYGVIGEYLARLGVALGMSVLVSDPYKKVAEPGVAQVAFEDLLARADFVVCLAIANEATENLMNAAAFARMRPSAFFINLSRGNLVDEAALARALDDKAHRRRRARCRPRAGPEAVARFGQARRRDRHAAYRRADARGDRASGLRHRQPGEGARRRPRAARRRQCRCRASARPPAAVTASPIPPARW